MKKIFVFLAFCFICPEVFGFGFSVSPSDKSQQYLGMIFGSSVGGINLVADSYNATLSMMFERFNFIIVTFGAVTLSYLGIVSTINTAREGEAMGKKISMWVPMRAFLGILLMVPGPTSGYSVVQMTVLWVVLNGIGAANSVWNVVLGQLSKGVSAVGGVTLPVASNLQLKTVISNVLLSNTCMYAINNTPNLAVAPGPYQRSGPVKIYTKINPATQAPAGAPTQIMQNGYVMVGLQGEAPPYDAICGQYTLSTTVYAGDPNTSFNIATVNQITNTKMAAVQAMFTATDAGAQLMSSNINFNSPNYIRPDPGYVWAAKSAYVGQMSQIATGVKLSAGSSANSWEQSAQAENAINNSSTLGQQLSQLSAVGWIHAGSYYFELSKATTVNTIQQANELPGIYAVPINVSLVNGNPPAQWQTVQGVNAITLLNPSQATDLGTALANATAYYAADSNVSPASKGITISNPSTGNGAMDGIVSSIRDGLQNPILEYLSSMTTGVNPLLNLGSFGTKLMLGAEIATFVTILISFVLSLVASIASCVNPAGYAVTVLVIQIMPIIIGVFTLMWTMGATLGVYVPMIPYLIFTTTAFGWIIAVIESVVGAPLIALSLTHPSGEEMGKAGSAVVILLNLFLRPTLMIFGFVIAGSLLDAGIAMINYGFLPALNQSTSPSIFSVIAVLGLYISLIISIVNKSFSLVYMLPNQIMRWMGGPTENFDPSDMTKQAKEGHDAGAAKVQGGMDTASKKAGESNKESLGGKGEQGGGADKGGGGKGGGAKGGGGKKGK